MAAEALSRLYESSRMFVNFFQPSFRLADKVRHGAKVTKKYYGVKRRLGRCNTLSSGAFSGFGWRC